MAAVASMNPIEHAKLSEQVKRAEDRRPADPGVAHPNVVPQFLGAEMVLDVAQPS